MRTALILATLLVPLGVPAEPAAAGPPASQVPPGGLVPPAEASPRSEGAALLEEPSPPAGSPAEVALWRAGVAATQGVWHSRSTAAALQIRAKELELSARLTSAAGRAAHEEAERLTALRSRVAAAWAQSIEIFERRWPVDPYRGCGYAHLHYDSAMRVAPGPSRQGEVEGARVELQTCVDRATVATRAMVKSNQEFEAAIAAATRALEAAEAGQKAHQDHEAQEAHEKHEKHEGNERGEARGPSGQHGHSG